MIQRGLHPGSKPKLPVLPNNQSTSPNTLSSLTLSISMTDSKFHTWAMKPSATPAGLPTRSAGGNAIQNAGSADTVGSDSTSPGPDEDLTTQLGGPLRTPCLDRLHPLLWLAGLPRPARPLHRQRLLQRAIVVTERADEHLVWHDQRFFIKPLPAGLLDPNFWARSGGGGALGASARGLLLSYTWLVAYPSDLRIALDAGLLPPSTTWDTWAALATDVRTSIDGGAHGVDRRYRYGELRLSRLDTLYRLGLAGGPSIRKAVFGFMSQSSRCNTFFESSFSWIIVSFIYITVVLSTMQVALSTERLSADTHFQDFSYYVAIISLCFVLLVLALMAIVWVSLFSYHLLSTRQYYNKSERSRRKVDEPL